MTTSWLLGMPFRVAFAQSKKGFWKIRYALSILIVLSKKVFWVVRSVVFGVVRSITGVVGGSFWGRLLVLKRTFLPNAPYDQELSKDAGNKKYRVIVLAPIDWSFRVQRPQHLARALADTACDVLYVNPTLYWAPFSRLVTSIKEVQGVRIVSLFHRTGSTSGRYLGISELTTESSRAIAERLHKLLRQDGGSLQPVVIVQQPGWLPVVERLGNFRIIADWMDLHRGFSNIPKEVLEHEAGLWWLPDAVTYTSPTIRAELKVSDVQPTFLVRNATWPVGIDKPERSLETTESQPLRVGYYGAVADWFNPAIIKELHDTLRHIEIDIVGSITDDSVHNVLKSLPRVRLLGEIPYIKLRDITCSWQVGMIPFKVNDLTIATNPVKLYEYASMGLPVVSTSLPEVMKASEECSGIFVANTPQEFAELVRQAMNSGPQTASELRAFARRNTWTERASHIKALFDDHLRVSVVVLAYNNSRLTIQCLESLLSECDYTNKEIILVDNGSKSDEIASVEQYINERLDSRVTLIKNNANFGYAKGMNVGIRAATGDYLVLLNNDTQVTHGWLRRLLRHTRRNPQIGLLGPVTDNCGNQARISVGATGWKHFISSHMSVCRTRAERARTLGFFCVMFPRNTLDKAGLLSEDYGLGFFEDDDYCAKINQVGDICAIAHDVFVHHELSATFDLVEDSTRRELFARNLKTFESKWGSWTPHSYTEPGDDA
jgi:GT2 family glycosyltransferase/glycosyltransferase involved in cell wall biosynthesis